MPASASNEGKGIKRPFLYQRQEKNQCGAGKQKEGGKRTQEVSCFPGTLLQVYGVFLEHQKNPTVE